MAAEADHSKWSIIYPIYIDKSYSQSKGRRISKEFALETPTAAEIVKAVQDLKLPCAIESEKRHPVSPRVRGRVRFQLTDDSGTLWNDEIDNKQTLLLLICNNIAAARKEYALKNPEKPAPAAKGKKGKK